MMQAECLLRTGKGTEAATVVSQVRARAFAATPAKATVMAADLEKKAVINMDMSKITKWLIRESIQRSNTVVCWTNWAGSLPGKVSDAGI
ncbi:hypothetical protein [Spirosoma telluris]|uniref:hypothetical protein n=1 Tax=Spirosoma telluris TaxID=2183553 RepID=UPI002FC34A3F